MSTLITEDKYSVSKMSSASPEAASLEKAPSPTKNSTERKSSESIGKRVK